MKEYRFRVWDGQNMYWQVNQIIFNHSTIQYGTVMVGGFSMLLRGDNVIWMQYSGVDEYPKNKNSWGIYEDDIVEVSKYSNPEQKFYVFIEDIRKLPQEMFGSHVNYTKVVGNKYENPELLKLVYE